MRKILLVAILCLITATGLHAGFFSGGGGGGATDEVGTVTDGKWCVGDSAGLIQCTEAAPVGAGDVTGVGDCAAGACYDGSDDGGTYVRLYDGDSNYTAIVSSNVAANKTITLPPDTATLATLGLAETFAGIKSFTANPRIYDGSHYLTIDADGLTGDATITFGKDTNNLYINNGTGVLDIAAGATVDANFNLTVNTAAVTLVGKSGGSTLTLPTALDLDETMTNANLCKYTTTGTKISCDVAIGTDVQAYDAELAAVAGLTFADVSIIQLTGAAAAATLTSDGASKVIASNAANDAIEFTTVTAAHLDPVLTFANGDLIDLSGITHSGATDEGLVLPTWANVSPTSDKKFLAADGNSLKLYNGGWVTIGATAAPVDATYLTLSLDATLTGERVFTEGLAIDFTDGGANSTLTIAFDPTELTGDRTWAAGGAATNTWTWNVSTGTDPSLTFGNDNVLVNNTLTATKLITGNAGLTVATGQNITLGTTQWNSGDEIDGTKIKDADYGDVTVSAAGAWAVEDDSHAHGSTTITLASTNLSDTSSLAYLAGAQTFTANNVFGNADTDTLTLRSLLVGGNSRAVWIAGSAPTPTYATGTNELYVAGDIETAGTVYAASFSGGAGTDGQRGLTLTSNTALTPTADQLYFINDALYFSQAGTQKTPARLEDTQTFTGKKTFQGDIAVGDASNAGSIDIYDGSSNYFQLQVPALSAEWTMILPTGAGTTGQYLKTTTSGTTSTMSWDTPAASADTTGGTGGVQFNAGGVLTSDAGFVFTTATDKLALGSSGGATTGTLDLYYTGTTYAATLTPNASMAADVTITMPSYATTLLGSGANTFTGLQGITAVNAASGSADVLTLSGTLGAFNGGDTFRSIYLNYTNANHTSTSNTAAMIDIAAIAGDANSNLYGIRIGALTPTTGADGEEEVAIKIGSGWDYGLYVDSPVLLGTSASFSAASATSSIPMKVGTETASGVTAAGAMYFESDTEILTIGDGATSISLDMAPNVVYTFPAATSTLARTDAGQTFTGVQAFTAPTVATSIAPNTAANATLGTGLLPFSSVFIGDAATNNVQLINTAAAGAVVLTLPSTTGELALKDSQIFTTYIEAPYLILGSAATAADAGAIRMANNTSIAWEADGAGVDVVGISVDASEVVQIASAGASAVTITPVTTVVGGLIVGPAAPDDVQPTLAIKGDADSDAAGDTTEAFTITLTPNATPTLATWGFTSTQSAGYTFDKPVQAPAKFVGFTGAATLTAAAHNGALVMMTTANEVTMWDCTSSTIGHWVTLWARDAEKIEVVPASGDQFYLFDGTGIGADDELDMAATAGTKVTLMCTAADEWRVVFETAACADGGAAD